MEFPTEIEFVICTKEQIQKVFAQWESERRRSPDDFYEIDGVQDIEDFAEASAEHFLRVLEEVGEQ